jgi:DNA end-binding protein Ku
MKRARERPNRGRSSAGRGHHGSEHGADGAASSDRALWKGVIEFGLVEIPVGLVSAESPKELKLSLLDRRDFSPIGYNRYNKNTQKEVEWADIVKGYEYQKGDFVVLSEKDLREANPKLTQTVSILHFVDGADIDPIYFDKPYYLQPLTRGKNRVSKGYILLREALKKADKVGIAKVVIRTREYLAAVGVRGEILMLYLLRFDKEIRSSESLTGASLKSSDAGVQPKEIEMAEKLVESMAAEWKPERYKDEYTSQVMSVIDKKIAAGDLHSLPSPEDEAGEEPKARGEIIDLRPLLQQSLAAARSLDRASRTNGSHTNGSRAPRKPTKRRRSA